MLRELRTFMAVAREGTFARAGDKVGLTQAAVSAQMQRLEAELGFDLFERTGRSAHINAAGQRTLARAQELVRLYEGLGSAREASPADALVRIGAIASAQRGPLASALAQFHKDMPGCRSHVVPGVSMHLLDKVDAGELDLALIIRPPASLQADLHWTPLAHEPFRLLVPRRLAGSDWRELLATQPFVRYDRASFGGRQVDRFLREARIAVREVSELDEPDAIVQLVANGLGVALVPEIVGQGKWPAGVRALDLGRRTFHRDIGLVRRMDVPGDAVVGQLTQAVRAAYISFHGK
ncbi:MAG: LysR family transcriptional regulator [Ramlibacter sp.]|nr:LysR family transcriptional regulator [Ramlibacter sp.]